MNRKLVMLATLFLAAACLFVRPSTCRADSVSVCAVSGHNGAAELVSYVAAVGNGSSGNGFASFYMANGNWIDGYILNVHTVIGGTSTVQILGFVNDVTPVYCTLSIVEQTGSITTASEVDNAKISLSVMDSSNTVHVFSSMVGDNEYGWITRSK